MVPNFITHTLSSVKQKASYFLLPTSDFRLPTHLIPDDHNIKIINPEVVNSTPVHQYSIGSRGATAGNFTRRSESGSFKELPTNTS